MWAIGVAGVVEGVLGGLMSEVSFGSSIRVAVFVWGVLSIEKVVDAWVKLSQSIDDKWY